MNEIAIYAGRPSGRMSETEYDYFRYQIRLFWGDTSRQAAAKRDQALAILFAGSGWTQDELAAKEGKSQQWMAYRVRFGRFLNFTTTGVNPESLPSNLSERRFRDYWEPTDKTAGNERIRFREVQKLIEGELHLRRDSRPAIGRAILEQFGDGAWHELADIAIAVADCDEDHVRTTMQNMINAGTFGAKAEKKRFGTSWKYRIAPRDSHAISIAEIRQELGPIIKDLHTEGRKHLARIVPQTMAQAAVRLQRVLDKWTSRSPAGTDGRPDWPATCWVCPPARATPSCTTARPARPSGSHSNRGVSLIRTGNRRGFSTSRQAAELKPENAAKQKPPGPHRGCWRVHCAS
jgi:hypothetical protein